MEKNQQNNLISVIIPVYKVEKFLDRCVSSVLSQTYSNLEIILVDDGSPDLCPKMCDEWEKKDKRIKVIHKENGGLSDARNYGLNVCTGDYVAFIDSDDYYFDNAIENYVTSAVKNKADIVVGNYRKVIYSNNILVKTIDVENVYFGKTFNGNTFNSLTKYLFSKEENKKTGLVSACNKLYKREFIEKNNLRFIYGIHNEDWFFNLTAYYFNPTVNFIDSFIFNYYIDNRGNTLSAVGNTDFKWVVFCDEFYKKYYPQLDTDGKRFYNNFYNGAINSLYSIMNKKISDTEKSKLINEIIYSEKFIECLKALNKAEEDFYHDEKHYAKKLRREIRIKKIKRSIKKILKR